MEMPDSILLRHVNVRSAFLDIKSIEPGTTRTKPKYKLLTIKGDVLNELDILTFHVLTSQEETYIKDKTIDIYLADWEYRDGTHLNANYSKLCNQVVDFMSKESVLSKMRDTQNRFSYVGLLKQAKFEEIIYFIKDGFQKSDSKTDFDVKEVINSIFNKKTISEDILKKFGLL